MSDSFKYDYSNSGKGYGDLILILLLVFLSGVIGCGAGGSAPMERAAADLTDPGAGAPVAVPLSVTVKSGRDFECIVTSNLIRCRTLSLGLIHPDLGINSAAFTAEFGSNSGFVEFATFEDSLCFSAEVAERPVSRTPGLATYCFGEPSGGMPGFNPATQGTDSLDGGTPFSADDGPLSVLTDLVTDGAGSERSEECDDTDPEYLTCDTFVVDL